MSEAPRTVVLGGGPAGLAAGYTLCRSDHPCHVIEAADRVGGLAKTIDFEGALVDLGPHRFFTKTKVVLDLWNEVLGEDIRKVDRLTRIYYRGKFFYYPLRPWNAFFGLGPLRSVHAVLSYMAARVSPHPDESTFEGWVTNRFGRILFETFFKTYTEKLWGLSCEDIGADWASQRIKGLSLLEAIRNAFLGNAGGRVKSLVDQFEFPRLGTGMFYEKMAEGIEAKGGVVTRQTRATRVHHDGAGRVTAVEVEGPEGPRRLEVDHLFSSMPLTLLLQGMQPAPPDAVLEAASKLRFRNTILTYLMVEGTDLFPDNWIYVHSPEVRTGRITNFRNWVPEILPEGSTKSPLVVEFWCFDDDEIWTAPEDELVAQAARELESLGLVRQQDVGAGKVVRLRRCYPVYEKGYRQHLDPIVEWLRTFENLQVIGRYGAFKYNNQDHSILMGVLGARNVLGEDHDLWTVNSDTEYHEEIRLHPDPNPA